jgi:hypothetical protein
MALADAIDSTPPPDLGPEETSLYPLLLEAYVEAVGNRAGRLRVGDGFPERRSRTGRFALAVKADLVFDLPDGSVEARLLRIGSPWSLSDDEAATWPVIAAIVLKARPHLTYVEVPLLPPGSPTEVVVTDAEAMAFAPGLTDKIIEQMDLESDAEARPGPYCGTCEFLYGCPAIRDTNPSAVIASREVE